MKKYGPYLLYQIARFGALSVPQMIEVCQGRCARSSLYRALDELTSGRFVYPILNPASKTRAYYATKEGCEYVFGKSAKSSTAIKAAEVDHTIICAEVLLELCRRENVTGISTQFELDPQVAKHFCHERVPDGVFRLTQDGQHYELALEVESTVRNCERINDVLDRYWKTFKRGMDCTGLLVVAMDETIFGMYTRAIQEMPDEFKHRVRVVKGIGLEGLPSTSYGERTSGLNRCLDFTRISSHGTNTYVPINTGAYLLKAPLKTLIDHGEDSNYQLEVS